MKISYQPILFTIGILLSALSVFMILPALADFFNSDPDWEAFALSSGITAFCGILLSLAFRPQAPHKLNVRDTFLLTSSSWLSVSFFASLPFIFSRTTNSNTDSLFETISGLTTTGATVITGLDYLSLGVLLWRALLQWLGGIGIVVMALTIMPILRIGGMHLFRSEFSDRSEKILPRVSQIASAIFGTYLFFTLACTILLWLAGMTFFDAICHAMSTIATGGFSTHDASVGFYNSPMIELIMVIFMIIGGTTLMLYIRLFQGDAKTLFKDSQVRTFIAVIFLSTFAGALWQWHEGASFLQALRETLFNATSILTTSGFASTDFNLWGTFSMMILFILMLVGGCTGSTAGGIKIFRYQVLFSTAATHMQQMRHPHGIFLPRYNGKPIPDGIFASVFTLIALYVFCFGLLSLGLAFYDLDLITCLSGAATALGNVGPGLGPIIGPAGNFAPLPDGAKWMLMVGMLLGRLEYVTILILFSPRFWRD